MANSADIRSLFKVRSPKQRSTQHRTFDAFSQRPSTYPLTSGSSSKRSEEVLHVLPSQEAELSQEQERYNESSDISIQNVPMDTTPPRKRNNSGKGILESSSPPSPSERVHKKRTVHPSRPTEFDCMVPETQATWDMEEIGGDARQTPFDPFVSRSRAVELKKSSRDKPFFLRSTESIPQAGVTRAATPQAIAPKVTPDSASRHRVNTSDQEESTDTDQKSPQQPQQLLSFNSSGPFENSSLDSRQRYSPTPELSTTTPASFHYRPSEPHARAYEVYDLSDDDTDAQPSHPRQTQDNINRLKGQDELMRGVSFFEPNPSAETEAARKPSLWASDVVLSTPQSKKRIVHYDMVQDSEDEEEESLPLPSDVQRWPRRPSLTPGRITHHSRLPTVEYIGSTSPSTRQVRSPIVIPGSLSDMGTPSSLTKPILVRDPTQHPTSPTRNTKHQSPNRPTSVNALKSHVRENNTNSNSLRPNRISLSEESDDPPLISRRRVSTGMKRKQDDRISTSNRPQFPDLDIPIESDEGDEGFHQVIRSIQKKGRMSIGGTKDEPVEVGDNSRPSSRRPEYPITSLSSKIRWDPDLFKPVTSEPEPVRPPEPSQPPQIDLDPIESFSTTQHTQGSTQVTKQEQDDIEEFTDDDQRNEAKLKQQSLKYRRYSGLQVAPAESFGISAGPPRTQSVKPLPNIFGTDQKKPNIDRAPPAQTNIKACPLCQAQIPASDLEAHVEQEMQANEEREQQSREEYDLQVARDLEMKFQSQDVAAMRLDQRERSPSTVMTVLGPPLVKSLIPASTIATTQRMHPSFPSATTSASGLVSKSLTSTTARRTKSPSAAPRGSLTQSKLSFATVPPLPSRTISSVSDKSSLTSSQLQPQHQHQQRQHQHQQSAMFAGFDYRAMEDLDADEDDLDLQQPESQSVFNIEPGQQFIEVHSEAESQQVLTSVETPSVIDLIDSDGEPEVVFRHVQKTRKDVMVEEDDDDDAFMEVHRPAPSSMFNKSSRRTLPKSILMSSATTSTSKKKAVASRKKTVNLDDNLDSSTDEELGLSTGRVASKRLGSTKSKMKTMKSTHSASAKGKEKASLQDSADSRKKVVRGSVLDRILPNTIKRHESVKKNKKTSTSLSTMTAAYDLSQEVEQLHMSDIDDYDQGIREKYWREEDDLLDSERMDRRKVVGTGKGKDISETGAFRGSDALGATDQTRLDEGSRGSQSYFGGMYDSDDHHTGFQSQDWPLGNQNSQGEPLRLSQEALPDLDDFEGLQSMKDDPAMAMFFQQVGGQKSSTRGGKGSGRGARGGSGKSRVSSNETGTSAQTRTTTAYRGFSRGSSKYRGARKSRGSASAKNAAVRSGVLYGRGVLPS